MRRKWVKIDVCRDGHDPFIYPAKAREPGAVQVPTDLFYLYQAADSAVARARIMLMDKAQEQGWEWPVSDG
jgi:hypothetical protein